MALERLNSYYMYMLDFQPGETGDSEEPTSQQYIVYEASDKQRRQGFDSFEQVIDFLLDELLGGIKEEDIDLEED